MKPALKNHIIGLAHVGYVVEDLEKAVAEASRLYGLVPGDIDYQPAEADGAQTLFAFFNVGAQKFEYIQPVSRAFRHLLLEQPSGGGGINHLAWEVDDLPLVLAALAEQGIRPGYVTPDGVVDLGARRMVYLDPATTGGLLVELLENVET